MQKIIVSWLAVFKDFSEKEAHQQINTLGPTLTFHRHHYAQQAYDAHVIFYSSKTGNFVGKKPWQMQQFLGDRFQERKIILEEVDIADNELDNYQLLKLKVDYLLLKYKNSRIDILIGPGTRLMQMIWVVAHTTLKLDTRLFQLTPKWARKKAGEADLIEIIVEKNTIRDDALTRQLELQVDQQADIYMHGALQPVYHKARQAAAAGLKGVNFLISGQTGTGKEKLASFIRKHSPRSQKPFRAINCSAFSDELLSSELFGHIKGAFTGADSPKKGLFEELDGGILFLDEINDMSPFMQRSLLRVLEQGEIRPVGSTQTRKVDVQIIAATNEDLIEKCQEGKFRWDLYYRLAIVEFELPSLMERGREEIKAILQFFIKNMGREYGRKVHGFTLSEEAKSLLLSYNYPGNFREMRNIIQGLYALNKEKIELKDLPKSLIKRKQQFSLKLDDAIKTHIEIVYRLNNYNIAATARDLGIKHQYNLKKKMEAMGIQIISRRHTT